MGSVVFALEIWLFEKGSHTKVEDFFAIIEDNVRYVYESCQVAVRSMVKTGGGSIINITSVASMSPDLRRISYGLAKSTMNFLSENIAVQYARFGIRCNCILPGYIRTAEAEKNMTPEFLAAFTAAIPMNHAGLPDDVANLCVFLASDKSSYITGEKIRVAGGFGVPSPLYPLYVIEGPKS